MFGAVSPLWPDISSEELRERIGANIRATRLKAGMTQQELADAAGISRVHISYIESGKFGGIETIHAIAKVLDADWRKLLSEPKGLRK